MTATSQTMKVSRNGQVSIPAAVRARWHTEKVAVIDMGDYLVIAPQVDDPVAAYRGWLAGSGGPSTDELRRNDRLDEQERDLRKYGTP